MLLKLSAVHATTRAAAAVLILSGLLAACSSTPIDPTAGWSPNKIYAEAKDEASAGAFEKAIVLYEKLEGRAAGTPLAQQAQLEKAHTRPWPPWTGLSNCIRAVQLWTMPST
jgi:outer membrane protein assembly factor BamD